jgi:hypothetical protein
MSTEVDEERELMLLEAAEHIKMTKAQRALNQVNVALSVQDTTAKKDHSRRVYTFVVITGRIWSCPFITRRSPAAHIISAN